MNLNVLNEHLVIFFISSNNVNDDVSGVWFYLMELTKRCSFILSESIAATATSWIESNRIESRENFEAFYSTLTPPFRFRWTSLLKGERVREEWKVVRTSNRWSMYMMDVNDAGEIAKILGYFYFHFFCDLFAANLINRIEIYSFL